VFHNSACAIAGTPTRQKRPGNPKSAGKTSDNGGFALFSADTKRVPLFHWNTPNGIEGAGRDPVEHQNPNVEHLERGYGTPGEWPIPVRPIGISIRCPDSASQRALD
jgi:hypothetical protein